MLSQVDGGEGLLVQRCKVGAVGGGWWCVEGADRCGREAWQVGCACELCVMAEELGGGRLWGTGTLLLLEAWRVQGWRWGGEQQLVRWQ